MPQTIWKKQGGEDEEEGRDEGEEKRGEGEVSGGQEEEKGMEKGHSPHGSLPLALRELLTKSDFLANFSYFSASMPFHIKICS